MRTTSQLESVNSSIQRSFPKSPNIFTFIENLRLFDSIESTNLYQLRLGSITNPRLEKQRQEDRKRNEKIKLCTESLKKKELTVLNFLSIMADEQIQVPFDSK